MKNKRYVFGILLAVFTLLTITGKASAVDVGIGGNTSTNAGGSLTGEVFPSGTVVGVSATFKNAVDAIVEKTSTASDEDFCSVLDTTMLELADNQSASLAWNKGSYQALVGLDADASVSLDQKAVYESLKKSYDEVNTDLVQAVDTNTGSSVRAGVATRSAYLEILAEYRTGTPDDAHIGVLKSFIGKAHACVSKEGNAPLSTAIGTALDIKTPVAVVEEATVVTKADVDTSTSTDVSADSVSSKTQFSDFAKSVVAKNDAVVSVSGSSSNVQVVTKEKGRLFAFIPVMMNVKTDVAAGGQVTVHYPWYRFMTKVSNKITSTVVLDALPKEVTASTTFSAHAQATTVDAVVSAFATPAVAPEEAAETESEVSE